MARSTSTRSGPPRARRDAVCGAAVFTIALGVRLVYLYQSAAAPTFHTPVMDAADYDILARCLLDGGEPSTSLFWQPVFYPLFLTVVYALSGSSILAARLVQCVLGAVTCWLTYRLGRRLFGRKVGFVAGLITALYGPLIFFETELLATGWAAFWAVALVLLLGAARQRLHWAVAVAVGVGGALSVVTRPTFLLFLLAASLWLTCSWARKRPGPRRLGLCLVGLAGGFALVAVPVAAANYRLNNHFGILPASGGINLYLGNNPEAEVTTAYRPGRQWSALSTIPARHGVTGDVWTVQQFYYDRAVAYARRQPGAFVRGLGHKTLGFFNTRELPRSFDVYAFRQWSSLLSGLAWKIGGFGFPFGVIFPLAVVGLVAHRRTFPAPVWLLLALYPLAVILVFPAARYRAPLVPVLAVAAAAGGAALVTMVRAARWRSVTVYVALLAVVVLSATLGGPFPAERIDYAAELHLLVGNRHLRNGRPQAAITAFEEGLRQSPDDADLHARLGEVLLGEGRAASATAHLEAALRARPGSAANHALLGIACEQQGELTRAITEYRRAVMLDAGFARAWANLGAALLNNNQAAEAIRACQEAIRLEPDAHLARYNLALALDRTGQRSAARAALQELLARNPTYEPARRLLRELGRQ